MAGMLSRANKWYQENIGQPFVESMPGQALSGFLGVASKGTSPDAYKLGQAIGVQPGFNVPGGIFKAAVNSPEIANAVLVGVKGLSNLKKTNPELYKKELSMLEQAKQADELGVFENPMVESANMYGWFKDKDGGWKRWISDEGTKFGDLNKSGMLGEKMQHPSLYNWYPDLARQQYITDTSGSFRGYMNPADAANPNSPLTFATNPQQAQGRIQEGVMLHEGTHGIQHRENWAPGGNSQTFDMLKAKFQSTAYDASEAQTAATLASDLMKVSGGKIPESGSKEWRIAMSKLADLHNRNPGRYPGLQLPNANQSMMEVLVQGYMPRIRDFAGKDPDKVLREGMIASTQRKRNQQGYEVVDNLGPSFDAYKNMHGEVRARQPQRFWENNLFNPTAEQYTGLPPNAIVSAELQEALEKATGVGRGTYQNYFVGSHR